MILLGVDCETTGLNTGTDRITELGLVVWCTERNVPMVLESFLINDPSMPELSEEITKLTGLTNDILKKFGRPPGQVFDTLVAAIKQYDVKYLVAHNAENFDKPILISELSRHGHDPAPLANTPWIDTRTDLIFEKEPDSRRLKHLALDYGFINPFAHRAVFDVLTMMRVLSYQDIGKVIDYQKVPFVTVRALVSYDDRDLAKAQRYSWEKIGDKTYPKMWVKRIKLDKFEAEQAACKGFKIVRLD